MIMVAITIHLVFSLVFFSCRVGWVVSGWDQRAEDEVLFEDTAEIDQRIWPKQRLMCFDFAQFVPIWSRWYRQERLSATESLRVGSANRACCECLLPTTKP